MIVPWYMCACAVCVMHACMAADTGTGTITHAVTDKVQRLEARCFKGYQSRQIDREKIKVIKVNAQERIRIRR